MKIDKKPIKILFLSVLMMFYTQSFAQISINAGDLQKFCVSKVDSEQSICVLIVKAYMDGYIEGIAKGVFDTYKYDKQVFATVKDMPAKDFAPRLKNVVDNATCIQKVSVSDMVNSYVEYMKINPSLATAHYRNAMTKMIISKYCSK